MTIGRILSEFGFLGCVEVGAAFFVAVGCGGEMWILLNKLTRQIEPLGNKLGLRWRLLAWADRTTRPFWVFLKVKGRKLPEAKENLLERFFVSLVALGVTVEFIALMFSLHEFARLNSEAGEARKEAAFANERTSTNEVQLEILRKENLDLRIELAKKLDPMKQPPADISARVSFKLGSTRGEAPSADGSLKLFRPGSGPSAVPVLDLKSIGPLRKILGIIGPSLYVMEFRAIAPDQELDFFFKNQVKTVADLTNKLHCAELTLSCLPMDAVLLEGTIDLFSGGTRVMRLPIAGQTLTNTPMVLTCVSGTNKFAKEYWQFDANGELLKKFIK